MERVDRRRHLRRLASDLGVALGVPRPEGVEPVGRDANVVVQKRDDLTGAPGDRRVPGAVHSETAIRVKDAQRDGRAELRHERLGHAVRVRLKQEDDLERDGRLLGAKVEEAGTDLVVPAVRYDHDRHSWTRRPRSTQLTKLGQSKRGSPLSLSEHRARPSPRAASAG